MIRKIAALTLCFTAIAGLAGAQELGIELDGGLQGMRYTPHNSQTRLLPGGSFGVDYTFRLGENLGLLTGVTAGLYRTQATPPQSLAFAYPQVDDRGSAFLYNVRFTGYKETERTLAVTIPVLLQYHTDGAATQWYIDAGGKLFLPANTNLQVSAQQMSLSGYYPNYDLLVSNLPKHGFGTVSGWKNNTSTQLKPGAALSAGTGLSLGISPGVRLYAGVYADYGLTALKTSGDSMPLVTYSPSGIGNVKANGLLRTSGAGQPKLLSFGLQLRLTWGARPANHPARHKTQDTVLAEASYSVRTKAPNSVQAAIPNGGQPKAEDAGRGEKETQPVASAAAGAALSDSELLTIQEPIIFGILGQSTIPEGQQPLLNDMVTIMQQHPDLHISIVGYTCDGVQQTEDTKLGEARAKAVARYLQRKGIDRHRIDITAEKEGEPSSPYDPAANYRNRRVLITPM